MYRFTMRLPLRKYKYYMLSAMLFAGIITYFLKTTKPFFCPTILCTIDGHLSPYGYTTLKSFIRQQQDFGVESFQIIHNLQKKFAWIKDINVTITPQSHRIAVIIHKSFIAVNNQWLVTPTGSFFEKKLYKDSYYRSLPSITINNKVLSNQQSLITLYDYVQKIPSDIFNFYTLFWEHNNRIYFFDLNDKNFTIITSAEKPLTSQQLSHYLYIKGILYKNNSLKKIDFWIADLRFSNYIIIAKEGRNHGS